MFSRDEKEQLILLKDRVDALETVCSALLEGFGNFGPALKALANQADSEEKRINAELVAISSAFNLVFSHFRELYSKTGHEADLVLPRQVLH